MNTFAKIGLGIGIAGALWPSPRSTADLILMTIHTPQQCPEGLTVQSQVGSDGLIDFDVSVDAEAVAHADARYAGRVRSRAFLQVGAPQQTIASVKVHGASEGKRTRYQFSLSPDAAKTSELLVTVSLHEKDGKPTFGGGVSLRVPLAGFEPTRKAAGASVKQ